MRSYQRYQCKACGYCWHHVGLIGTYSLRLLEHVSFMYLRCLSFNQVIAITASQYDKKIFTKDHLIDHIERLADRIPTHKQITDWLKPKRSGYYALDGTWLKYRGYDLVLLILFDVRTLDVVAYLPALQECEASYTALIKKAFDEISPSVKGFFCDGDPGLLKALKSFFKGVPIQLCVFHKEKRAGQIIPFKRSKTVLDKQIKIKVQKILFAPTKQEAVDALEELKAFAKEHESYDKLKKIVGILKRNFTLLLTHFDHPEMSPYNNVLEGFNYMIKRRTRLMKGFKKPINITRWLKLLMLDWRFHPLKETKFKDRRNKSPLQLASVDLPEIHNWLTYIRKKYPN